MKIVWYGPGDFAWCEPENDADEALIEKSKQEGWTIAQLLDAIDTPMKERT